MNKVWGLIFTPKTTAMMRHLCLLAALGLTCTINAQNFAEYTHQNYTAKYLKTFYPRAIKADYTPRLQNAEAPPSLGDAYREYLMRIKKQVQQKFPQVAARNAMAAGIATSPVLLEDMGTYWNHPTNGKTLHVGGTPNDNSIAISEDGFLLCSWNSSFYAHDLNADTPLFKPNLYQTTIAFADFADTVATADVFDPKVLYDPIEKRFVAMFLSVNRSVSSKYTQSKTVIAFSSTSNPADPWYVSEIEGHPKGDSTWSDYPAIAITKDELFFTINLVQNGKGWIEGFSETVVWQINKKEGFAGVAPSMKLWSDIKYQGKPLRYFRPVHYGLAPTANNMYFISNRSIPVEFEDTLRFSNDSIFLIEITGKANTGEQIKVTPLKANCRYHTPPDGRQANNHTLFSNDARVLGAVYHNGQIHFTGNSLDSTSGRCGIYHGIITNIGSNPGVVLNILGHPDLDLGYPNIASTATVAGEQEVVIGVNHTSPSEFAGISAFYYDETDGYAPLLKIKSGENYVNRINSPKPEYERWGDYSGIQKDWAKPKQVWIGGYYGRSDNNSGSWYARLLSPRQPAAVAEKHREKSPVHVYPNPFDYRFHIDFELHSNDLLNFALFDMDGRQAATLGRFAAFAGSNTFSFDTSGLPSGFYILEIKGQTFTTQKLLSRP
jgi:hypothetical protein